MHIDRRLVGFGLFLITIGAVMVAVRQGLLSEEAARQAWTLWPLILVGSGLSIVLAGRPGAATGGLVLAITFGAMLGGVAATGVFPGAGICSSGDDDGATFSDGGGDLGPTARVTISQDCGDLTIGTVDGTTWSLSGASRDGRRPEIQRLADRLRITTRDDGPFDLAGSGDWTVILPRATATELDVKVNGGQSRLAFDSLSQKIVRGASLPTSTMGPSSACSACSVPSAATTIGRGSGGLWSHDHVLRKYNVGSTCSGAASGPALRIDTRMQMSSTSAFA